METLAHRHLPMITLFFPVLSSHKSHFSNLFSFLFRIGIWMFSWAFASVRDFTPTKHFFFFLVEFPQKRKRKSPWRLGCLAVASRRVASRLLAPLSLSLSRHVPSHLFFHSPHSVKGPFDHLFKNGSGQSSQPSLADSITCQKPRKRSLHQSRWLSLIPISPLRDPSACLTISSRSLSRPISNYWKRRPLFLLVSHRAASLPSTSSFLSLPCPRSSSSSSCFARHIDP